MIERGFLQAVMKVRTILDMVTCLPGCSRWGLVPRYLSGEARRLEDNSPVQGSCRHRTTPSFGNSHCLESVSSMVTVFPASVFGLKYIQEVHDPLPPTPLMLAGRIIATIQSQGGFGLFGLLASGQKPLLGLVRSSYPTRVRALTEAVKNFGKIRENRKEG